MSFVKKAIKKVIKTVKKVVKSDIFKWVVIAAAVFFTAGLAAGGFAAFGTTMSAAGGGLGGFFSAVGSTIATGASAIAGALGFQGTSTYLAGYGGAMAEAAGLTASAQILAPVAVNAMTVGSGVGQAASVAAAQAATANAAGTGFLGAVKGIMGKKVLGDVTIGQLAANGITAGITAKMNAKANEKEYANSYVAGGLARGGRESDVPPAHTYSSGSQPPSQQQPQVTEPAAPTEEPSVAAQLAYGQQAQPQNRIQQLIQSRGPLSTPGYGGTLEAQQVQGLADYASVQPQGQIRIEPPALVPAQDRRFTQPASRLNYQTAGGLV